MLYANECQLNVSSSLTNKEQGEFLIYSSVFSFFVLAVPSSIPTQTEISNSVALRTSNYAKIVGHPASPTSMKVPTMAVILALVAVIVVSTVIWLILLVRRR